MRFARYNGDQLGLVSDDGAGIVSLTDRLDLSSADPLREVIESGADVSEYADADPDVAVDDVRLESPIRRPGKIVAAPRNYMDHREEMMDQYQMGGDYDIRDKGYFLKAPSSIVGPADSIELPYADRRCDYELEFAFVMGESIKDATPEEAVEAIYGYTTLLDMTMRGDEDRTNRKSYDSFTVVGPYLTHADAIEDPQDLDMELSLNGEVRQQANTSTMIYTCGEFASYASISATIEAGDLVTTGTPSGVGELSDGDVIDTSVERVGEMSIGVTERDVSFAERTAIK